MLQPFKFITIVMKDKTNAGVTALHNTEKDYVDRYVLAHDLRYHPVTLGDDGLGVPFSATNQADHEKVGVLMESFNKPLAQHKVLIHGIVPMPAEVALKPGMPAYWDVANQKLVKDKTANTPYIGTAMTVAKADKGIIDVLIV